MIAAEFVRMFQHQPWHAQAECAGMPTDWFYPPQGQTIDRRARDACSQCPVRAECAAAGETERWGTWGGITPLERRQARRAA